MKIKGLGMVLTDWTDEEIQYRKKPLTVRRAILVSLDNFSEKKQEDIDIEEKYKRHKIGERVYIAKDEVDLDDMEAETVRKCAAMFVPSIYGKLLVAVSDPKKKEDKEV